MTAILATWAALQLPTAWLIGRALRHADTRR